MLFSYSSMSLAACEVRRQGVYAISMTCWNIGYCKFSGHKFLRPVSSKLQPAGDQHTCIGISKKTSIHTYACIMCVCVCIHVATKIDIAIDVLIGVADNVVGIVAIAIERLTAMRVINSSCVRQISPTHESR